MSKAYVYVIRSDAPGTKIYVGKTTDPERRWKVHQQWGRRHLDRGDLYADMARHGIDQFRIEVVSEWETEEEAYEEEATLIEQLQATGVELYQKSQGWQNSTSKKMKEVQNRPEVRAKKSEAIKEALSHPEVRAKISEANKGEKNPMFGRTFKHSDEAKAKISDAAKAQHARKRAERMGTA